MFFNAINIMQAHWITVFSVSFSLFFTQIYWFYVLSIEKAKTISLISVFVGSCALTSVLFNLNAQFGVVGGLMVLVMWVTPASLVWIYRDFFLELDQKKLIGLQIFRLIGAFFILEMFRDHIPLSFALPAGLGDIFVGCSAAYLCLRHTQIPRFGVIFILTTGLLDFLIAFFFGFSSLPGPFQLFAKDFDNQVNLFPTGMIPLFLVPYAIVFHMLSFINFNNDKVDESSPKH